jgi:hypothetical protein
METTRTSSLSSATREALFDELVKIAEEAEKKQGNEKLKRWVKNTAIIAAGAGAGQGLAMLGEKALASKFGPKWAQMSAQSKMRILGPALGAATAGSLLAAQYLKKVQQEHE